MSKPLTILGIETSCDETAAAVVRGRPGRRPEILANIVLSQWDDHAPYGGVVPEIAARAHVEVLDDVIVRAIGQETTAIISGSFDDGEADFSAIENALADRPYTYFNGRLHTYSHTTRHGRDYINLGTTGGAQRADNPMSFDHVTLVTMDGGGPTIANLKMDGILDRSGGVPE